MTTVDEDLRQGEVSEMWMIAKKQVVQHRLEFDQEEEESYRLGGEEAWRVPKVGYDYGAV
jgi:hypothetical protein